MNCHHSVDGAIAAQEISQNRPSRWLVPPGTKAKLIAADWQPYHQVAAGLPPYAWDGGGGVTLGSSALDPADRQVPI